MEITPDLSSKILTRETSFDTYLLIVDVYYKLPRLHGMENITTEEVMDKIDIFQSRFGKLDKFGWWKLERISVYEGSQFTLTEFK